MCPSFLAKVITLVLVLRHSFESALLCQSYKFGPKHNRNKQTRAAGAERLNKYGLLTKREVKMTGYWPSSFFACLWTETKSRSINTQKKNEANIQSS